MRCTTGVVARGTRVTGGDGTSDETPRRSTSSVGHLTCVESGSTVASRPSARASGSALRRPHDLDHVSAQSAPWLDLFLYLAPRDHLG